MIHTYYLDLMEFVGGIVFLIVFKVFMLLGMNKLSAVLSDEPAQEPKPRKPRLRPDLEWLRWGLIGLLTLAAIWQIRPRMLFVSVGQLVSVGMLPGVAHWWVAHALWLNIWSIVIELTFAGVLLSFPESFAVRITSVVLLVYSLGVWLLLQGMGHFLGKEPSFLGGSPGTGLLVAVCSLPLIFQKANYRMFSTLSLGAYWLLFTLFEWLPSNHFWSGEGYTLLAKRAQQALPGPLASMVASVFTGLSHGAVISSLVFGVLSLVIAIGVIWLRHSWFWGGSVILSLAIWAFAEGFGLGGGTAFALGTAPFVVVLSWLARPAAEWSRAVSEGVSHESV
ncbi:hypothetical protein [Alicyclobacillus sp. ALC3]|uniref:hypothetical protein n=1 Tax=Alicyclobacillus sp. ALC3 TaxID=2796143 RepID=UPI00237845D8|nr:hypothetical protein [Alicyclobacillus sp. ALC3]WDL97496.1 hypothetical protein JC200_01840 [Alicyclobacillus sp. ALC3]